ncbi:unnamed protein product, partial [marine sediment metagenome]
TVEQFIYNIYLNSSGYIYEGNYPWNKDVDILNIEIIMIFLITIAIISIMILTINYIKSNPSRYMVESEKQD